MGGEYLRKVCAVWDSAAPNATRTTKEVMKRQERRRKEEVFCSFCLLFCSFFLLFLFACFALVSFFKNFSLRGHTAVGREVSRIRVHEISKDSI